LLTIIRKFAWFCVTCLFISAETDPPMMLLPVKPPGKKYPDGSEVRERTRW